MKCFNITIHSFVGQDRYRVHVHVTCRQLVVEDDSEDEDEDEGRVQVEAVKPLPQSYRDWNPRP